MGLRRARRHFKVCNVKGARSEEAWQVFICIPQAVRDEPFEDLSLYAQNPLGGRDCIHMILSDGGPNQAKPLPVLSDHRAPADQLTIRICQLPCQQTSTPL